MMDQNRGVFRGSALAAVTIFLAVASVAGAGGAREQPRPEAYDFPLTAYQGERQLGGSQVTFHDVLAGGLPVVLNFWAALCPPCRVEMPDFNRLAQEYEGQVTVIGVDVGAFTGLGTQEQARQLLLQLRVTYPAAATTDQRVLQEYGVLGLPATYFILPDGTIHQKWTSILTPEKLREMTAETLVAVRGS